MFERKLLGWGVAVLPAGATLGIATAGLLTAAVPQGVWAQALEEVVVTARKREESLQDIGGAVSAFSATQIERRFAGDISELTDVSPNLIIDDTAQGPGGVAAITLRGIGVAEVESSFDPAVGVVVDGVFLGKASGSITKAIDLERIEVARGPQGTLFGRNAIGGVINLTRTKPTGELGGKVRASYGNYDTLEFDAMLNFAITDNLWVKLTGSRHDQGQGYYSNTFLGTQEGELLYEMIGANLLWMPREGVEVEYTFNHEEYDQDTPPLLNVGLPGQLTCDGFGFCSPAPGTPTSGDRFNVTEDGPNEASFDADTHIVELRWDINDRYRADYIFGYRETDEEVLQDFDAVPITFFETSRPEIYEQTSHELRLTYSGERLTGTVGAYVWNSEYTIDLLSFIGFVFPGVILEIPQTANQETDSYAFFGEADYEVFDNWVLTVGGRWTRDEKSAQITNDFVISQPVPVEESWSEFTPKVGVKWFARDDLMLFGLYSSGYRSGGFNGRPTTQEAADLPYDPETVDNIEFGFKSEWMQNRLRLNGSVFRIEYDDKQEEQSVAVTIGTGQQTVVANAANATIWGVELDFLMLVTEQLTIGGNLGWLDATYDEFTADIGRGGITDNTDLEFRRAPEWNATLHATYEWNMYGGEAWVRGGWHFIGEHAMTLANSVQTNNDDQHLVDASVNYKIQNATFSVYGRNLLDEDGYTIGFDVGGVSAGSLWSYATPRAPQTFGVSLMYEF